MLRLKFLICRLRLALYKGLGFDPVINKNTKVDKMLVRKYLSLPFIIMYNYRTLQDLSLAICTLLTSLPTRVSSNIVSFFGDLPFHSHPLLVCYFNIVLQIYYAVRRSYIC